jgi:hypothetical protein
MSAITFATVASAVAARNRPGLLYVRVGGEVINATEATVRHGVDQPVGTCTVYCNAPRPASVAINAEIEIEMGYPGAVRRRFIGVIPDDESVTEMRGHLLRIEGVGRASRLAWPERNGIELAANISLKDAFRSLCALRGVETYFADDTTYVDGITTITLGGNDQINGGAVRFDSRRDPLAWLIAASGMYGYRVFDSPDGAVRLARVSGLPPESEPVAMAYAEGLNCYRIVRRRSNRPMVNYWTVEGARYTDADGATTQIRSIPAEVPYADELAPLGYRADTFASQDIVTDEQAAGVRNALEIDRGSLSNTYEWECAGHPELQPGDVVTLEAPTHGLATPTRLWLTAIEEAVTDRGYLVSRMAGWAGGGQALAAGNDCVTVAVGIPGDGCVHMGDQTLGHYKDPTPDSSAANEDGQMRFTVDFTVADSDYTTLKLSGRTHGTNSINTDTAVTGSVIEVWQLPDPSVPESGTNEMRRVGSIELPTADEELSRARNYADSNTYWQSFVLPITGSLKTGAAELRIVAAELDGGGYDDFEIKDLELTYCGVGIPVLPGAVS